MVYDPQKVGLIRHLLKTGNYSSVLVFASTKENVKKLEQTLLRAGLPVRAFHSDLEQAEREDILRAFKSKQINIIIGTDSTGSGLIHAFIPLGTSTTILGNLLKVIPNFSFPAISVSQITVGNIYAKPNASISTQGGTTICEGDTLQLTSISGAGLTYQWNLDGTDITGATAMNYAAVDSGYYTVRVTNASGCDSIFPRP